MGLSGQSGHLPLGRASMFNGFMTRRIWSTFTLQLKCHQREIYLCLLVLHKRTWIDNSPLDIWSHGRKCGLSSGVHLVPMTKDKSLLPHPWKMKNVLLYTYLEQRTVSGISAQNGCAEPDVKL